MIKYKLKLVPHSHSHIKCLLVATCGWWLLYQTAQMWDISAVISFTFITNNIFYSFVFKWGERTHIWCLYCLFPQSAVYQVVRFSFSKLTERKNFSVPVLYLYQYTLNLTNGLIALVYYNGFRSGNRESHHFSWSVKIWFKIYLSGEGFFCHCFCFSFTNREP